MMIRDCECGRPECPVCSEAAAVAQLIRREFEDTVRQARVPTPEIMWWRAQMRARQEAARAAARPIVIAQALALAALVGLLISVAGWVTVPAVFSSLWLLSPLSLPVLLLGLAVVCWLVIFPLALYLAD